MKILTDVRRMREQCRANPADMAARRVLADALEDAGETREAAVQRAVTDYAGRYAKQTADTYAVGARVSAVEIAETETHYRVRLVIGFTFRDGRPYLDTSIFRWVSKDKLLSSAGSAKSPRGDYGTGEPEFRMIPPL